MSFKVKDHYYNKAKKDKFLARSVYKLEEIDKKNNIINKGDSVLDLGYYPGSWIQYTSNKVGEKGSVVGIDIQPINKKLSSLKNVTLFETTILPTFARWLLCTYTKAIVCDCCFCIRFGMRVFTLGVDF